MNLSMPRPRWTIPEPRQVILKVDGYFHADDHRCSAGAVSVLWDYEGRFIAASTLFLQYGFFIIKFYMAFM
jgi:hypothetical protein